MEQPVERVTRYEVGPERSYITKSANHYSPVRHDAYASRVAYRAGDAQTRTFSSDQNRMVVHEYRPASGVHATTAATRERHSPLRTTAGAEEKTGKAVSFAN